MLTTPRESALAPILPGLLLGSLLGLLVGCSASRPAADPGDRFQGVWEGYSLGKDKKTGAYKRSSDKLSITFKGNALRFFRDEDFWWEATFTLPEAEGPKQMHATITRPEDHAGEKVIAFYKFDDGTLTLAGVRSDETELPWPERFEDTVDTMTGRYELQKLAQPRKGQ